MLNRGWRAGLALVAVAAIVVGYRWWASDERAINIQLTTIADALSVAPHEGEFQPMARMATLRRTLAADVQVSAGPAPASSGAGAGTPLAFAGRDQVLALVSRWVPPPEGITVAFVDVQVAMTDDRAGAEVYCTATITSRGESDEPTVDARELIIGFTKVDGTWLVGSVRAEETLMR